MTQPSRRLAAVVMLTARPAPVPKREKVVSADASTFLTSMLAMSARVKEARIGRVATVTTVPGEKPSSRASRVAAGSNSAPGISATRSWFIRSRRAFCGSRYTSGASVARYASPRGRSMRYTSGTSTSPSRARRARDHQRRGRLAWSSRRRTSRRVALTSTSTPSSPSGTRRNPSGVLRVISSAVRELRRWSSQGPRSAPRGMARPPIRKPGGASWKNPRRTRDAADPPARATTEPSKRPSFQPMFIQAPTRRVLSS
jgi:hypothetical protein